MHCGFIDCRDDDLFGACPSFESHPTRSRWGGNRWSFAGPWRAADSPAKYTLDNVANALWHDQSEFPEQAANLVGLRRSSLHEALPHPVKTEHGLPFNVLDRNEPHRRSSHRLADRFGVGRVVLVALRVRLDELRCHQSNGVPKCQQLARPMMRARARLRADQARREVGEERSDLVALELLAQHDLAVLVDAVCLEYVLGQIVADCRNLHGGRSFRLSGRSHVHSGTSMSMSGGASIPLHTPFPHEQRLNLV